MSKQQISGSAGRDQYNISGNRARLKVDNRVKTGSGRKLVTEVIIGIIIALVAGYLLFLFHWN